MSAILDKNLRANAATAKGKVVVITGGANGLGRQAGSEFAAAGAKIVIGDLDMKAAANTIEYFKSLGGDAVAHRTDVTKWQQQVDLFQLAIDTYGRVDMVVANAGVGEIATFEKPLEVTSNVPEKPNLITVNVNLIGVIYTARLAFFHFARNKGSHKALVLLGSIASLNGIPLGPMYTTAKHGVLGLTRSLTASAPPNTRVAMINPWFAATAIVEPRVRLLLRGLPYTPIPRVGAAIFCAATDPDLSTSGSAYVLPDGGLVHRIPPNLLDSLGAEFYQELRDRLSAEIANPQGNVVEL